MINIFCDESCHLQNDDTNIMVLGALSVDSKDKNRIINLIRTIKRDFNIKKTVELKWTKASKSKLDMYKKLIDLFFYEKLYFRVVIAHNKKELSFSSNDDYNTWYYKMYFLLLDKTINNPNEQYKILLDIKDTLGAPKVTFLHNVLSNNIYDFKKDVIKEMHQIDSRRNDLLQLCDILIGIFSYDRRNLTSSPIKAEIVKYFKEKAGVNFYGTNPNENKLNVFDWGKK
ncbi:DUF3800 domain-containing protein [Staphylococcus hominis]|uniref:DUF3800 domain-containing protein n=1 Tax=Staphylococcus hominis TaxID=1290 RepID=UPI0011A20909|nr:DUF3800 domain-containing protein [Staphylococcus hominis]